ncbi:MAG: Fur family transcriptional regulator [Armatimonadota bacterium]|nr:Fur family transcriptional regulator [Armatimonadota bacterium]MDR7475110.1 Fur family transcriptional regulator [Armatimonadota bacterium]
MTAQRRAVLQALGELGCARQVSEIHARARRLAPRLGLVTVYRTLDALAAEGVVRPVFLGDGRTRYESAQAERHHHHLVCLGCGRVDPFEDCSLQRLDGAVMGNGFAVATHRLELFGHCLDCRGRA